MSSQDHLRALVAELGARAEGYEAIGAPEAAAISALAARLDEPLRVAIVGRVKAGKSTLLNALVGERLAPTDAGECTRIVTWYRHGVSYRVFAHGYDGGILELPFHREAGKLQIDLGTRSETDIRALDVEWPARSLKEMTLIDTPGLASLDDETSSRTRDVLGLGDDRPAEADIIMYLMRHMHQRDAEYPDALTDHSQAPASAACAIALLSRADEIGGGLPRAMRSAQRIAERYEADHRVRALCACVLPLIGLLAETALTLSEREVAQLRVLSSVDPARRARALLGVDEVLAPDLFTGLDAKLTVDERRTLVDRLGMYGLRLAIERIDGGSTTAAQLVPEVLEASGLPAVTLAIRQLFVQRASVLKARAGLVELRRLSRTALADTPELSRWLDAEVERLEVSNPAFVEMRLLDLVSSAAGRLAHAEADELVRLGSPGEVPVRLGLEASASAEQTTATAVATVDRWRSRGADPLRPGDLRELADHAVRVAEQLAATSVTHAPST